MITWLLFLAHPDGDIALLNDAALNIAPKPSELAAYARQLEIEFRDPRGERTQFLEDSGYVRVLVGGLAAFVDIGPIGPDSHPAHAHADTLSFELSYAMERIIVDSGVSTYDCGVERSRERGTG